MDGRISILGTDVKPRKPEAEISWYCQACHLLGWCSGTAPLRAACPAHHRLPPRIVIVRRCVSLELIEAVNMITVPHTIRGDERLTWTK